MDVGLAAGLSIAPVVIFYIVTTAIFYRNTLRGDFPHVQHQLQAIVCNALISCLLFISHLLVLLRINLFCASEVVILHMLTILHITIYWIRATENTLDVLHYFQRSVDATQTGEAKDKKNEQARAPAFPVLSKILTFLDRWLPRGRVKDVTRNPWKKDANPMATKTRRLSVIQVASFAQNTSQSHTTTRLTATNIGKLTVVFGFIFVILILIALLPIPSAQATRSTCFRGVPYIGLYIFMLIMQLLGLWFQTVRRNKDKKRFNEFFWVNAIFIFMTVMSMIGDITLQVGWAGGPYFRAGFWALNIMATHSITIILPILRNFVQKGEEIQFTPAYFETVLNDPTLFSEFKETLKDDFCLENGVFYEEASTIAVAASQISPRASPDDPLSPEEKDLQEKVQGICRKYISAGSPSELNIPSTVRKAVKTDLENGKADFTTLAPVIKEVCQMMYRNNFQKFVNKKRDELNKSKA